jgi:hypothetical protein
MSSRASLLPGFLVWRGRGSSGCLRSHPCTASSTSSLVQKVFPPRASFSLRVPCLGTRPCRLFVELQHVMDNMVSWTMTDAQHGGPLSTLTQRKVFPHDVFCLCAFKVSIWLTLVPCVLCPQHCYISSLYFVTLLVMSIYKYRMKRIFMPFSNFSYTVINYLLLNRRMYCKTCLGAAKCLRDEGRQF